MKINNKTKNSTKSSRTKSATDNYNQIKDRAYFIWLEKQLPELDCWLQAEAEFSSKK
ncbi:MAG: DUF2934 domain-containing protein [Candidatus Omnitrophota bacterium]